MVCIWLLAIKKFVCLTFIIYTNIWIKMGLFSFSDNFWLWFYFNHALWTFVHEDYLFILPIACWHILNPVKPFQLRSNWLSWKIFPIRKLTLYNIFTQSFLLIYFQSFAFRYLGVLDLFKHKDIFLRINRSYKYGIYM